jgi:hypothetical protein
MNKRMQHDAIAASNQTELYLIYERIFYLEVLSK